jgi:hypothetical protein
VIPQDRRWAIAIAIAIAIFFVMVILAGRAYWTGIDDDYFMNSTGNSIEATFTLWMLRSDSKNIPIQTNPPLERGSTNAEGRIYIQREYIAGESEVTLQLRNARPFRITTNSPPMGAFIEVEVYHAKIPSHRPIIVVNPKSNSTRTTEIYLDELEVNKISEKKISVDAKFESIMFSDGYSAVIEQDIYTFTGSDNFWEIEVYDSIADETESFNGMALFKVRIKLIVDLEDGSQIDSGWIQTQFFAIDLVEPPE